MVDNNHQDEQQAKPPHLASEIGCKTTQERSKQQATSADRQENSQVTQQSLNSVFKTPEELEQSTRQTSKLRSKVTLPSSNRIRKYPVDN
jgi:hypothetical protein